MGGVGFCVEGTENYFLSHLYNQLPELDSNILVII